MATYELNFDGALLARGFWLYVWEIVTPHGERLYYVGRTGDSSSVNAQSPFNRMAQHLGFNANSNVLRKRLTSAVHNLDLETCHFKLVAHGPIMAEEQSSESHRRSVNTMAALEKALADAMRSAGYKVINDVSSRKALDLNLFGSVRAHFGKHFDLL